MSTADKNREATASLANDLSRLLREFSRDYERRIGLVLAQHGYPDIRPAHCAVLANLGTGAVRVTELADHARVTQQAMGKMLKELERMGYVARDIDSSDKRARAIRLTPQGEALAQAAVAASDAVRGQYAARVGERELAELELRLRNALGRLELACLPGCQAPPAVTDTHKPQESTH